MKSYDEMQSQIAALRAERRILKDTSDVQHYIIKLKYLQIWINAKIRRAWLDERDKGTNFSVVTYGPETWSFEDYWKTITGEITLWA